jgi:hypothetical protein
MISSYDILEIASKEIELKNFILAPFSKRDVSLILKQHTMREFFSTTFMRNGHRRLLIRVGPRYLADTTGSVSEPTKCKYCLKTFYCLNECMKSFFDFWFIVSEPKIISQKLMVSFGPSCYECGLVADEYISQLASFTEIDQSSVDIIPLPKVIKNLVLEFLNVMHA